jgi:hypothetical protein
MPPKADESSGSSASLTSKLSSAAGGGSDSVPDSEAPTLSANEESFMKFCLMIEDRFTKLDAKLEVAMSTIEAKSFSELEALRSPHLGLHFDSKSRVEHRPSRQSLGSSRSLESQDSVKIVKSSFRLEKSKFEFPTNLTEDGAFDDAILKFIEECDRHIEMWLNLPENKDKEFEGSEVFALVSLPASVQKRCAHNLELIFHKSEIVGWSLKQIQQAKYWDQVTTEEVKREILIRKAKGIAKKDVVKTIQSPAIAWTPGVGLIHLDAFETYKSKMITQLSRLSQGGVSLSFITIKDAIISAIPDRDFKSELYAQFGHSGSLPGPDASGITEEYSVKDIFDFIRQHIVVIKQKGLTQIVNKNSEVSFHTPPTVRKFGPPLPSSRFPARAVQAIELQPEIFPESDRAFWSGADAEKEISTDDCDECHQINTMVLKAKSKECHYKGVGPDGKLLCPYLGNPDSAKCGFIHPAKELDLKGKGVSRATPGQPKKVVHTLHQDLGISYVDDPEPSDSENHDL